VHIHAHISSMREAINGLGRGYALDPFVKLIHKRVPMDSTFLRKLVHQLQLFLKETSSTRVEHLESLLSGRKPNIRHLGGNQPWSGFMDTDSV
jgi:hypothetical protein